MSDQGKTATIGGDHDELAYRTVGREFPKPITAAGLEKLLTSVRPFVVLDSSNASIQALNLAHEGLRLAAVKLIQAKERVSGRRGEMNQQDQHEESSKWAIEADGCLIDTARQNKRCRFAGAFAAFKLELLAFHAAVKAADAHFQQSRAGRTEVLFSSPEEEGLYKYNLWCFDEFVDFCFMQLHSLYAYLGSMPSHKVALDLNCPQTCCGRSIACTHRDSTTGVWWTSRATCVNSRMSALRQAAGWWQAGDARAGGSFRL